MLFSLAKLVRMRRPGQWTQVVAGIGATTSTVMVLEDSYALVYRCGRFEDTSSYTVQVQKKIETQLSVSLYFVHLWAKLNGFPKLRETLGTQILGTQIIKIPQRQYSGHSICLDQHTVQVTINKMTYEQSVAGILALLCFNPLYPTEFHPTCFIFQ